MEVPAEVHRGPAVALVIQALQHDSLEVALLWILTRDQLGSLKGLVWLFKCLNL